MWLPGAGAFLQGRPNAHSPRRLCRVLRTTPGGLLAELADGCLALDCQVPGLLLAAALSAESGAAQHWQNFASPPSPLTAHTAMQVTFQASCNAILPGPGLPAPEPAPCIASRGARELVSGGISHLAPDCAPSHVPAPVWGAGGHPGTQSSAVWCWAPASRRQAAAGLRPEARGPVTSHCEVHWPCPASPLLGSLVVLLTPCRALPSNPAAHSLGLCMLRRG